MEQEWIIDVIDQEEGPRSIQFIGTQDDLDQFIQEYVKKKVDESINFKIIGIINKSETLLEFRTLDLGITTWLSFIDHDHEDPIIKITDVFNNHSCFALLSTCINLIPPKDQSRILAGIRVPDQPSRFYIKKEILKNYMENIHKLKL